METKPLPAGALLPPQSLFPHALMVPEASSAAKAKLVDAMEAKPLLVGAPLPPELLLPHALMVPEAPSAANAWGLLLCPLQEPGLAITPVRKWTSMRSTIRGRRRQGKTRSGPARLAALAFCRHIVSFMVALWEGDGRLE